MRFRKPIRQNTALLILIFAVIGAAHAAEPVTIRVGIANASSDVGLFIADKGSTPKGYGYQPLLVRTDLVEAIQAGVAVKVMGDDEIYPDHQLAVILYGGQFIKEQPEAGRRFTCTYLRAVRDYNDALVAGRIAGQNAGEIIAILNEYTAIKDPAIYSAISTQGCNPNGAVNEASLSTDLQFYKDEGQIQGSVTVEQAIDHSFVQAALKELGPYKPKTPRR